MRTNLLTEKDSRPQSFVIGDFNNDDQMDIAVANSGTNTMGIFAGYGNISFAKQVRYSTGPSSAPYLSRVWGWVIRESNDISNSSIIVSILIGC